MDCFEINQPRIMSYKNVLISNGRWSGSRILGSWLFSLHLQDTFKTQHRGTQIEKGAVNGFDSACCASITMGNPKA